MSNNRIINIEDGPNGAPPPGPTTMAELLTSAETDWKFKRKDEAFVKVLGALAMISQGVAQAMKTSEAVHVALDAALKDVKALNEALKTRLPKE